LVAVVQEAYINGVSTRKVERLVEQLGIGGMSKSAVSRLCGSLDDQVRVLRERPLEGRYPYLWVDAKVEQMVGAAIRRVFAASTREEAAAILRDVCDRLEAPAAKVAALLEQVEDDLLAFLEFPVERGSKLRSTSPLERVNREIARRSDVVGIYPDDHSVIRLASAA
jgi:transposase-like protein